VLNNIDLKGMRIAVTGGTSGLGLALVRNFAASRARIAFVGRRAQLVERVSKETSACGIVGDVGLKEDIHAMALEIAWNLGGLDVLINNASSLGRRRLSSLPTRSARSCRRRSWLTCLARFA
jgi:NAD(P)-dependent dehydrogenase (short-subunit alcohol dehydrogenase family)